MPLATAVSPFPNGHCRCAATSGLHGGVGLLGNPPFPNLKAGQGFTQQRFQRGASFCCSRNTVSFRRKLTGTKYHGGDFVHRAPWRRRLIGGIAIAKETMITTARCHYRARPDNLFICIIDTMLLISIFQDSYICTYLICNSPKDSFCILSYLYFKLPSV